MDVMTHALEAYASMMASDYTDGLALNAIKLVFNYLTCAVVGALLGFLLFNVYPASVFMGDTGSLALGGFVAGTAYMMQMPFSQSRF